MVSNFLFPLLHYFCTMGESVHFSASGADMCLFRPRELMKGISVKAALKRGNETLNGFKKTERFSEKPSCFLFSDFYIIFHFAKFSRMRYFKFFNFVLNKILEIDSNFLFLF
jgi:hypothetical protein